MYYLCRTHTNKLAMKHPFAVFHQSYSLKFRNLTIKTWGSNNYEQADFIYTFAFSVWNSTFARAILF